MKRTYISPESQLVNIQDDSFIAVSINKYDGVDSVDDVVLTKEQADTHTDNSVWDDEW